MYHLLGSLAQPQGPISMSRTLPCSFILFTVSTTSSSLRIRWCLSVMNLSIKFVIMNTSFNVISFIKGLVFFAKNKRLCRFDGAIFWFQSLSMYLVTFSNNLYGLTLNTPFTKFNRQSLKRQLTKFVPSCFKLANILQAILSLNVRLIIVITSS